MNVTPDEINSMKRIMLALEGQSNAPTNPTPHTAAPVIDGDSKKQDTDAMKRILESLNGIGETTSRTLAENSIRSEEVEEALYTSRIGNSVTVRDYKISITETANSKRYSILENGQEIASDFLLYESAYSIVKLLNQGEGILSPRVRKIIHLEESYSGARNEAAQLKTKYQSMASSPRGDILAAKFQKARDTALEYKGAIRSIMEGL